MKTLMVILAALAMTGCASVKVRTQEWSFAASSLFKEIEVPKLDVGKEGDIHLEGYRGKVTEVDLATIIAQAVKAAIKP